MKKIITSLLVLAVLSNIAFASGGGEKKDMMDDGMTKGPFVALVTDTGGIDDKSFNQGTWEGVKKFISDHKLTEDRYTYLQSESDADYIPNLSTVSDEGYKLIIAPGFLFTDSIADVAANYPNTHYLIIDSVVAERSNVVSAVFSEEQGSFLVGVAAGETAKKEGYKSVGFIGGLDFDVIQRFESGFEAGVKAVAPDVKVLVEYAGSFSDTQRGQTIGAKLFDQGASIIFVAAGATGNGTIKEAKDRALQGKKAWVIGVDKDQYQDGIYEGKKSIILTSMLKRVDVAAYNIAEAEAKGEFPGGSIIKFDLANNGVSIPQENPNLSKNITNTIKEYEAKIKSGAITVPTLPMRLQ